MARFSPPAASSSSTRARGFAPDAFACWVIGAVREKGGWFRGLVGDTVAAFEAGGMRLYNDAILLAFAAGACGGSSLPSPPPSYLRTMKPLLVAFLFALPAAAETERRPERWYQERIAAALSGKMEHRVSNGRVDVLTETHASSPARGSTRSGRAS